MREHTLRSTLVVVLAVAAFAPRATSQAATKPGAPLKTVQVQARERIDKANYADQLKVKQLTGGLGLPELPPVYWDSPRDDLLYADRFPFGQQLDATAGDGGTPAALDGFIPSGPGGTGTTIPEIFKYLLPPGYEVFDPELDPIPLVIAYHGFGQSANSVAVLSTVDDECYERGWAYFAPTGMDDKLFGSAPSIQNVEAALNWMLTHFNIDPDRIYMVGFSMGGGITANFAARHRDPDGTMIAAIGIVAGTFDWTMSWTLGNQTVKNLMQHPLGFGGPPTNALYKFGYQKASAMYYSTNQYPPLSHFLQPVPTSSLASNLSTIPTYMIWDTFDPLMEVQQQEAQFRNLVQSLGGVLDYNTTTGTLDPITGNPSPHSWGALDEDDLFDFFASKVADRTPDTFHALMADSGQVSWMQVNKNVTDDFTIVDGNSDDNDPYVHVSNVTNATTVHLDLSVMGFPAGEPVHVNASAASGDYSLRLTGFGDPPAYLVDPSSGDLLAGTESDPVNDALVRKVSSTSGLDALIMTDPTWTTDLYTGPNPVAIGAPLSLDIDAPATSSLVLLFVGFTEAIGNVSAGYHITLSLGPPTVYVALPLDGNGNADLSATMPNNASLMGLTILLQTVAIDGTGGGVDSISNLWALHVQ